MLYLVPTPLGNLKDITLRAIEVLQSVELILCEDTRTSSKLLQHYNIYKPLSPYHKHNEHKIVQHLAQQLDEGKNIALITDAGTPGVSDPAFFTGARLHTTKYKSRMPARRHCICTCTGKQRAAYEPLLL